MSNQKQKQDMVKIAASLRQQMTEVGLTYTDIQLVTIREGLNGGNGYAHVTVRRTFDKTPLRKNKEIIAIARQLVADRLSVAC